MFFDRLRQHLRRDQSQVTATPAPAKDLATRIAEGRLNPPAGICDTYNSHNAGEIFIASDKIIELKISQREILENLSKQKNPKEFHPGNKEEGAFVVTTDVGKIPVYTINEVINGVEMVRHVIQQQAANSCAYAASAMIIYDACSREAIKQIDLGGLIKNIQEGTLTLPQDFLIDALQDTDLIGFALNFKNMSPATLHQALNIFGPLLATIGSFGGEVEGHAIVLNRFTNWDTNPVVSIRDPFHGWDIAVPYESLISLEMGTELFAVGANSDQTLTALRAFYANQRNG